MKRTTSLPPPDDATLVAWLDGELDAAAAARVAAAVQHEAALRARVGLLRAARAELAWALQRPLEQPPAAPAAPTPRTMRGALALLLAAAAVAVVVVLARDRAPEPTTAAQNEWLHLRVVAERSEQPLFSGIRVELEGRSRTATPVRLVPRRDGESDAELATRLAAEGAAGVAVVLDATVTGPDGIARTGPVARAEHEWNERPSRLPVELVDVRLQHPTIPPVLTVALEPAGAREDHVWALRRGGLVQPGAVFGCVPEQPGEYRVRFVLRPVPAVGERSPSGFEPLALDATVVVRGVVGAWSEPVDGLRARIAASTDRPDAARPLVIALQLRNDSDRPRTFNVTGTTMAKIPQPFHFDLLVDGEPCQQRGDLGVVTAAMSTGLALPVGGQRSVVALADCWRTDGRPLSALTGRRTLGLRFHFAALLFDSSDRALWQGRIDAPPVAIDFPPR